MTKYNLDDAAGRRFTFRDLCEAGETWAATRLNNTPAHPDTWDALRRVARVILDPVWDRFGPLTITYGHAGAALSRKVPGRVAPELDQHAGHELNRRGTPICKRPGQAVDFVVPDRSSLEVALFVVEHLEFDRLYYYGARHPIHVSASAKPVRDVRLIQRDGSRHAPPRGVRAETFLAEDPGF